MTDEDKLGNPVDWDAVPDTQANARDYKAEWQRRKAATYAKACELRDSLRKELGGVCSQCKTEENLAFHHPNGRDWEPKRKNLLQRMKLYWHDPLHNGGLALL